MLVEGIEQARKRTIKRAVSVPFGLKRDADDQLLIDAEERPEWDWPFLSDQSKWPEWMWLVLDAFGTRNSAIAGSFLRHLMEVCSTEWDDRVEGWVPDDGEMQTMLGIVRSHRPRNEADAASAAQVAATHIISMRVAARVAKYPYDTRMVSAYARLLQASAALSEATRAARGKGRKARQEITVRRDTHVHHHQHVHVTGGAGENDDQSHAKPSARKADMADRPGDVAALPGDQPGGKVVRITGRKRKARL